MKFLITLLLISIIVPTVTADQTFFPCGGDEKFMIMCIGDLENSPIQIDEPNRGGGIGTEPSIEEGKSLIFLFLIPIVLVLCLLILFIKRNKEDEEENEE